MIASIVRGCMVLTEEEKIRFVAAFEGMTNETTEHERNVIGSILGQATSKDEWRFPKGIVCPNCRKRTTNFDFFISTITAHGLEFVVKEAREAKISDSKEIEIAIANHSMSVTCNACGAESIRLDSSDLTCNYAYRYPGKGYKIRVSKRIFDTIKLAIAT